MWKTIDDTSTVTTPTIVWFGFSIVTWWSIIG